jgi:hypothetical protein
MNRALALIPILILVVVVSGCTTELHKTDYAEYTDIIFSANVYWDDEASCTAHPAPVWPNVDMVYPYTGRLIMALSIQSYIKYYENDEAWTALNLCDVKVDDHEVKRHTAIFPTLWVEEYVVYNNEGESYLANDVSVDHTVEICCYYFKEPGSNVFTAEPIEESKVCHTYEVEAIC